MPGVRERLGICARGARGIDRRLVFAVELLHREQPGLASQRAQDDELQPVMVGIVVRFAEDDVAGLGGALEHLVRGDESLGARVPDFPAERMVFRRMGAGGERHQGGCGQQFGC